MYNRAGGRTVPDDGARSAHGICGELSFVSKGPGSGPWCARSLVTERLVVAAVHPVG